MVTTLTDMADQELTMVDAMNQLRAEIGDVFGGNFSAFSRVTGINRTQLLLYLNAERDMGFNRLMACIAAVELTPEEFFARARTRATAARNRPTGETEPPTQSTPL